MRRFNDMGLGNEYAMSGGGWRGKRELMRSSCRVMCTHDLRCTLVYHFTSARCCIVNFVGGPLLQCGDHTNTGGSRDP